MFLNTFLPFTHSQPVIKLLTPCRSLYFSESQPSLPIRVALPQTVSTNKLSVPYCIAWRRLKPTLQVWHEQSLPR